MRQNSYGENGSINFALKRNPFYSTGPSAAFQGRQSISESCFGHTTVSCAFSKNLVISREKELSLFSKFCDFARTEFIYIFSPSLTQVRMAERSKAPDSSVNFSPIAREHSGPRLRAWVQIPLLTKLFFFKILRGNILDTN